MRHGPRVKCPACRKVMVPSITAAYFEQEGRICVEGDGRPHYRCPCCEHLWSQGWTPLLDVKTLKPAPLPWRLGLTPHVGESWPPGMVVALKPLGWRS